MVLSFQYISRYYFWAQIAELELLALGVKDFSVFNLMFAELSLLPKDFILNLNKPLTEFLHKSESVIHFVIFIINKQNLFSEFIVQYKYWNGVTGIIHGAVIFSLMISYNLKYSMLIFLFVGSMWVQERALFLFERTHKICVYSCPTPYCFHFFPYTSKRFVFIKSILIVHNHFRMSLLVVNPDTFFLFSSADCVSFLIMIDLAIILYCFTVIIVQRIFFSR
jgi:hypothetical protein